MALPQAADIQTSHYDAGADNPRLARAQLKTLLDKTRDLINAIDTAGGLAKLDAAGRAKLQDLFVTDTTLRFVTEGLQQRLLQHSASSGGAGVTGGDVVYWPPFSGITFLTPTYKSSFRLVRRDVKGHVMQAEIGARITRFRPLYYGLAPQSPGPAEALKAYLAITTGAIYSWAPHKVFGGLIIWSGKIYPYLSGITRT
ncbi:MAG: hypothetical protein OXU22_09605 [Gammaproteobacteria bacterium]|nr:hypothetical protein [Gammaproteobacteria bacterium]